MEFFKSLESIGFVKQIRSKETPLLSKTIVMSEEEFNKSYPESDYLILDQNQLDSYIKDLREELNSETDVNQRELLIEKAGKDLSKLTKITKNITRNGRPQTMTYYVSKNKANISGKSSRDPQVSKEAIGEAKVKNVNGMFIQALKSGKMTQLGLEEAEKHYDDMSHINKIRFEREWKSQTGKDYSKQTQYGSETKQTDTSKPIEDHNHSTASHAIMEHFKGINSPLREIKGRAETGVDEKNAEYYMTINEKNVKVADLKDGKLIINHEAPTKGVGVNDKKTKTKK
jgi:hypothetical protein